MRDSCHLLGTLPPQTAHRAELQGAARDPFNDLLTPGQSLLTTLVGAEVWSAGCGQGRRQEKEIYQIAWTT